MSDLISRQDAIDAICTWDKFGVDERGRVVRWYEGLEPYVHLRDVVSAIEKMPSAGADMSSFCDRLWKKAYDRGRAEAQLEPEQKTGKWINTYRNGFGNLIGNCSRCGRSASVDNYCPNCGTKMEVEG